MNQEIIPVKPLNVVLLPPVNERAIAPGVQPTPEHDLFFHGGATVANLNFMNFYVGGDAWQQSDMQAIDAALASAMSDTNLNKVMAQYFPSGAIASFFLGSQIRPGAAPAVVSQGDMEAMVKSLSDSGALDTFDLRSTVFNFMLPSGTILNTDPGVITGPVTIAAIARDTSDSTNGLGGYHGSIHPNRTDGQPTVYYAVGVYSEIRPDGTPNGIPVFDLPWKNVVATFYHELNEVRTDPDVEDAIKAGGDPNATKFLGWVSAQGEECGDFPVFEANPLTQVFQEVPLTDGSGTVPVQFQYSNAVHGPEGPRTDPAPAAATS